MPGISGRPWSARRHRAVARRRADDFHQRARLNARADRAVVRVETAHRNRDAFGQAETHPPTRRTVGQPAVRAETPRRRADREAPRASDRVGPGTPSTAGLPTPRSTSPCGPAAQTQRTMSRIVDAGEHRRERSRRARPSWPRHRTRQARPSGSARSSTTTTPTNRCRRSARDIPARALSRSP